MSFVKVRNLCDIMFAGEAITGKWPKFFFIDQPDQSEINKKITVLPINKK